MSAMFIFLIDNLNWLEIISPQKFEVIDPLSFQFKIAENPELL